MSLRQMTEPRADEGYEPRYSERTMKNATNRLERRQTSKALQPLKGVSLRRAA